MSAIGGGLINHSLSDVCYGLPAVIMGWTFEANDGANPSYFSGIIPEHGLFPVRLRSQRRFSRAASAQVHVSTSRMDEEAGTGSLSGPGRGRGPAAFGAN